MHLPQVPTRILDQLPWPQIRGETDFGALKTEFSGGDPTGGTGGEAEGVLDAWAIGEEFTVGAFAGVFGGVQVDVSGVDWFFFDGGGGGGLVCGRWRCA